MKPLHSHAGAEVGQIVPAEMQCDQPRGRPLHHTVPQTLKHQHTALVQKHLGWYVDAGGRRGAHRWAAPEALDNQLGPTVAEAIVGEPEGR